MNILVSLQCQTKPWAFSRSVLAKLGIHPAPLNSSAIRQKSPYLLLAILCLLLSACATKHTSIKDQQLPRGSSTDAAGVTKIRLSAIEQTALSFGAQSSLAWTSTGINQSLAHNDRHLSQIFNFNSLVLSNNVLPPVLSEGNDTLATTDPNSLRLADKEYKIESPPRFVTAAPTWRDYLWMNYPMPEKPNVTLLPKNREEEITWKQYYDQGWKDGVVQANGIFSDNMGRLKRDFSGMILYRKLLTEKIVTAPFVAKSDLGVTGDANQIRINDQVLRITATSKLVTDSKKWNTVVVPGTEGAIRKQGTEGTQTVE